MRSQPEREPEVAAPARQGMGWLEAALLLAALLTIVVGGLSVRLGPRWPQRLFFRAPAGIVIHHTATAGRVKGRRVDVDLIAEWHEHRGWGAEYRGEDFHIGYHYVVLPDGTVQAGRPEWMRGAHAQGHNDFLGVCLVGNFDPDSNSAGSQQPARPTNEQLDALVGLLRDLLTKYRLTTGDIYRHSDLGATVCPGDRFPMAEVIRRVKENGSAANTGGGIQWGHRERASGTLPWVVSQPSSFREVLVATNRQQEVQHGPAGQPRGCSDSDGLDRGHWSRPLFPRDGGATGCE